MKRTESSPQQHTPEAELSPDTLRHEVSGAKLSVVDVEGDRVDEKVKFCVADVRKRLNDHLDTPKKMFHRDPEDPSGLSH